VTLQRPAGEPLSPADPQIRWSYLVECVLDRWDPTGWLTDDAFKAGSWHSRDLMDARTERLPVFARAMTWFEDDDAETETTPKIPLQRGNRAAHPKTTLRQTSVPLGTARCRRYDLSHLRHLITERPRPPSPSN
jgi:hypothetical protein